MELNWKEYAHLYAPIIAYGLISAIGAIYTLGYRSGMNAIQRAAYEAAIEAKTGKRVHA